MRRIVARPAARRHRAKPSPIATVAVARNRRQNTVANRRHRRRQPSPSPPPATVTHHQTVMLTGASIIQLDAKGRLAIPSRYREALAARSGGQLVTTVSFSVGKERDDRSLWMYPRDAWKRVAKKVAALPDFDANHRVFKRFFIGYASDMEMDRSGRVLLPALLRDFAAIGKGVCLIGQSNKFELWSEEKWRARHDQWLADAIDMDRISPELEQLSL
ncbi:MAG: division/cell wall cluster transcriptional repressor MraZ [Gammaproteobacteria bacterium]|nr:division/cell wall cluster transcriptional repressor MraZ [Gammaproteobacteria bacterium]